MPNWPGIAAALQAVLRPSILQPRLRVPSIASLDFQEFKRRGVVGVVVDKDNCLTKPLDDGLTPSLRPAWQALLTTFGTANVLVVSNSAGTRKDPLLLQAESVSRNLLVPVLVHPTPKPGKKCAHQVAHYFTQLQQSPSSHIPHTPGPTTTSPIVWSRQGRVLAEAYAQRRHFDSTPTAVDPSQGQGSLILVIGDRVTTDMILARRIANVKTAQGRRIETISILTTELHEREGLGTMLMRTAENLLVRIVEARRRRSPIRQVPDGGQVVGEEELVATSSTDPMGSTRADERWEECTILTTTAKQVPIQESSTDPESALPFRTGWKRFLPRPPRRLVQAFSLRSIVSTLHFQLSRLISTWTPPPPPQIEGAYKTPLSDEYRREFASPNPTDHWRAVSNRAVEAAERAVRSGEAAVDGLRRRL
ncbi:BZ3500_MvSof-1268-A1-R1_Chr3-2g06354 [Microbotryum saponariae]|uniref:BZ3500_MvSof-1268-A1-R1_Chr3-2g06354 protein n=1 Tax=Microbotryum saponariae TaxID=289078 RepID=A0A2X0M587_9BASI|nr:BZ3500_MvSof-1268-A1-R1_Chr3-2g06354 [Microbotryum saponariae]SDA04325.1 BZ3501_MvSof-1269-A2-R1_Chr3-2g06045 [Microbotryum saponariae]